MIVETERAVAPISWPAHRKTARQQRWLLGRKVYSWLLWAFVVLLLFTQMLGIFWNTVTTMSIIIFGQDPYKGLYQVPGKNDDPYADRSIVCARQGRLYRPIQLSEALAASTTVVIEKNVTAANAINGYRVVTRNEVAFAAEAETFYAKTCGVLALTLDGILSACTKLGYDIEEDSLRIVDGVDGVTIKLIPDSLPVLITPFWDNAFYAKYTVPVRNGSACSFRLVGKYDDEAYKFAYLRGVSRSVRENRTVELLGLYGGVWRNGWYEHAPSKTRWYSDVVSSNQNGRYGVPHRQFDTLTVDALETNCSISENCDGFRIVNWWGSNRAVSEVVQLFSSIVIMNGKRYGIFLYEGHRVQQVTSYYSLGEFISNLSLGLLLFRWMGAQLALLYSFPFNGGRVNTIGVGALSCAKSFHILPLLLLPRLKTMMAAFWTSGCYFEGQQRALGEAWSVIYPSIGETVLLFHSVLNLLAKVLRRRVSDVLFGPMLLAFCIIHYIREDIAQARMFGIDGRVSTVVSSSEFQNMTAFDVLFTKQAYRLNGEIFGLFMIKVSILFLGFLPILWSTNVTNRRIALKWTNPNLCSVERALAVRFGLSGGIGQSVIYTQSPKSESRKSLIRAGPTLDDVCPSLSTKKSDVAVQPGLVVIPYEIARAGYVMISDDAMISLNDWFWFMMTTPLRFVLRRFVHFRIYVFNVTQSPLNDDSYTVRERASLCRVSDKRFDQVAWWRISLRRFR